METEEKMSLYVAETRFIGGRICCCMGS